MIARIRKAIVAGLLAAVGALITGLTNGSGLSWPAIGAAVGVGIVAALAVWSVPNAGPRPPVGVTGRYVPLK